MAALGIAVWIVSGLLAAMYLMAGMMKAKDPVKAQEMGPTMEAQAPGKLRIIGILELLGAVAVILPAALGVLPMLSGVAAAGLFLVQAFAIPAHIQHKDTKSLPMNVALLLMAGFVALARFGLY